MCVSNDTIDESKGISSDKKEISSDQNVPVVLKFWSNLYQTVPKICIPGTNLNFAVTILCTIIIFLIRVGFDKIYVNVMGWPANSPRKDFCAACSASIVHSIVLCIGLGKALACQKFSPSAKLCVFPQWWQDASTALLQLCSAYMIYDAFFLFKDNNWVLDTSDYAFFGHHVATFVYMTQCRVYGAGHMSAMTLMFWGEITNPFQNTWNISKFAIQFEPEGSVWHAIHPYLELSYAVAYFPIRAFVGPVRIIQITYDLMVTKQGRDNLPLLVRLLWIFIIWTLILGSLPWTFEAFDMIRDGLAVKYHKDWDYGPRYADEL
mmetsp:Transcript_3478/g.4839  ORF Transcript_3478/g.4839 Transcript_3478/m.4839 type:complete len:320 (-) Transcript_3478:116-1075(-)|eukprot:CAMPEP_0184863902 /NCGR_PEP_ID=MMETSP0580-20130426/13011_1 /TAXON_ID=1118495 /ORGANISM="Dactyliosolen fragilissimus" /LENGTH=319 /DNA_ID=CAMNT_0027362491 /DNA_START=170 /DNA_END=1129 /DNA_ORIENTATION=+